MKKKTKKKYCRHKWQTDSKGNEYCEKCHKTKWYYRRSFEWF